MFSTTGGYGPIGNFSRIKDKLVDKSGVTGWTYHDFRRAIATFLGENNLDYKTIALILNHTDNSVIAVYEKSDRFIRKHHCLGMWGREICNSALC